ncbi:MAG: phosphate acyltransferase PlsX [bacterium]|nr:phosphate acyltransferase PlsX [bacterium]
MRLVLDAMGSDNAPAVEIEGALQASAEIDAEIILVGQQKAIEAELAKHKPPAGKISIVNANEVIAMHESPAQACRQKQNSSIMVGTRLIKEGKADAFASAGNSGAVMTAGLMNLKRLSGVSRPAIATLLPTLNGVCLLIDAGANVDCKPRHLLQFAIMGDIYSRYILDKLNPTIGLLSIGEEETKGNELTAEAFGLIKKTSLNFAGNIEGRDIIKGKVDVVVCDGFVGNVVLKFAEGLSESLFHLIKEEIEKKYIRKVGALLIKPAFKEIMKRLDYAEYGGAPLLGLNGICIIGHGASNAKAVKNALKVSYESVKNNINQHLKEEIKLYDWEEGNNGNNN